MDPVVCIEEEEIRRASLLPPDVTCVRQPGVGLLAHELDRKRRRLQKLLDPQAGIVTRPIIDHDELDSRCRVVGCFDAPQALSDVTAVIEQRHDDAHG